MTEELRERPSLGRGRKRRWLAALIAPIVGILSLVATLALWFPPEPTAYLQGWRRIAFASTFYLIVGLPFAYAAEFIIGYPLYRRLVNEASVPLAWTISAGAVAGVAAFLPIMLVASSSTTLEDAMLAVGAGAIGGGAGGLAFWLVAFRGSASVESSH